MINIGGMNIGAADINAFGKEYMRTDVQKQADKNTDAAIEQNAANTAAQHARQQGAIDAQNRGTDHLKSVTVPTTAQLAGVKGENAKLDEARGDLATAKSAATVGDGVSLASTTTSAGQTGGGTGHSSGGSGGFTG